METNTIDVNQYYQILEKNLTKKFGRITRVVGLTLESQGPKAKLGDICEIELEMQDPIRAEVVGFKDGKILLMPLGNLIGVEPGCMVHGTGEKLTVGVGEALLGRVLDGLGNPMDFKGQLKTSEAYPLLNTSPDPLQRKNIDEVLTLGIKAIDGLITVGKGQRIGIFAGSGVGKSTVMGMIARNTNAHINVIALIGERGREVGEFIEKSLGEEGLKKSIVVVATSDQPAMVRLKAAETATAIAEYFRDQGKDVMLMMDSLTRYAMAQREVGLAIGEPPVSRGYTPSVYALLPKLLERAGATQKGSITGIYTVLVDGDDMNEPVADTARGILDGHIVLSRKLAHKNHYPAIDVLQSISRVMNDIVTDEHKQMSNMIKNLMATYAEAEDLINIGAYKKGSNKEIDLAIEKIGAIKQFLTQNVNERFTLEDVIEAMVKI